jgi:hypothetical protein
LVFLLLLIRIAGKRWVAEGRYDNLPGEPAKDGSTEN